MKVEIWSDVVCPWCYVGKRRFEAALSQFAHRDAVEVVWRSFELDPSAPRLRPREYAEHLAAKYAVTVPEAQATIDHMVAVGAQNGLVMDFDIARPGNTFDAHRLLHLAGTRGVQGALKERLMAATFTEGVPIGAPESLATLAIEVGLDPTEVQAVLVSDAYGEEVRADEHQARRYGINAVPFFVMGGTHGVAGAQSADVLLQVLEEAWSHSQQSELKSEAPMCTDETCETVP